MVEEILGPVLDTSFRSRTLRTSFRTFFSELCFGMMLSLSFVWMPSSRYAFLSGHFAYLCSTSGCLARDGLEVGGSAIPDLQDQLEQDTPRILFSLLVLGVEYRSRL